MCRIVGNEELRLSLEETISRLEETIAGLGQQLETGSLQLDDARRITVTLATKLSVVTFFEDLSNRRLSEAFANVSDDVRVLLLESCLFCLSFQQVMWSAPGGILLKATKKQMMRRMESSVSGGIVFDIKEIIIRDSFTVAVRVGFVKVGEIFEDMYQFMFLFSGNVIVGVKENTDKKPLSEIFD